MGLRILIVEDSADDAKLLVRFLNKQGFDVAAWERVCTEQAMQAALEGTTWDVILADHTMPEFNSFRALATLQRSGLDLPFIIVSGRIGEEVAIDAMKAGAHDYIIKGNLARLAPAIRRELQEATVRRERREAEEALRQSHAELEMRVQERTADLATANEELAAANEELAVLNQELQATNAQLAATGTAMQETVDRERPLRAGLERQLRERTEIEQFREEYVSLISHDLRTPLTALTGSADWLRRALERQGMEREAGSAGNILTSARRMAAMITDLVESARLESNQLQLHKEPTDLGHLVSELAQRTGTFEDRQRITVEASGPAPIVSVDKERIERAITNLITNALKYSSADKPVALRLEQHDHQAVICVVDLGMGIPPEDLPHLFQRHFRARTVGKREGLGLGLYITRLIAEAHGGHVCAESELGKGSTFCFSLPLA